MRGYGYTYDAFNRLQTGFYRRPGAATVNVDNYNESLTYDKNGNILTINRNGGFDYPISTGNQIDELHYTYNYNQLMKVTDATASSQGFNNGSSGSMSDYTYDDNGNMKTDKNKNITNIKYNHLNLPTEITFSNNNKINYLYNAAGQKVEKKVKQGVNIAKTEYLDGYQYQNEKLLFFPTAEGYVSYAQIPELQQVNKLSYVYNFTDHLGNIRLSYTEDPQNDHQLIILEENNYYPFGLLHPGYNKEIHEIDFWKYADLSQNEIIAYADDLIEIVPVVKGKNKYKYNSKEWQDELGLNVTAMDFRQYDNALGRFMNPDALSELAPMHTPYRFAFNNPIRYRDPLGLFEDDYRLNADGTLEKIRNTNSDEENGVHHIYNANETNSIEISASAIDNKITWDEKSIGVKGASGSSLFFNDTKEANRFYEFTAKSLISSEAGLVEIGNIDSESAQGSIVTINEINRTNGYDQGSEKIGASIISGIIEVPDVKIFRRSHSHFSRSDGSDNSPSGTYYNSDKANPNATTGDTKIHGKRRSQLGDRYPATSEIYVPRINVKIIYDDTGVLKRK